MIKGKFYTGLTSEMMARSRVVNRQETNFFWPDESKMEAVQTRKERASSLQPTSNANNNIISNNKNNNNSGNGLGRSESIEIKPKELFLKQLSSGIEFFDNVDAKTPESRRRRFKKIDNINLTNNDNNYQPEKKKLETFSSKIEFYDYDEPVKNLSRSKDTDKSIKNAEKEQPIPSIKVDTNLRKSESPDVNKKRITFQADASKSNEKTTKGILKNNSVDEKKSSIESNVVEVKPLHKRGLLPKNLSKSVENISKMSGTVENDVKSSKTVANKTEPLSAIIKEVNNLNLNEEKPRKYDRNHSSVFEKSERPKDSRYETQQPRAQRHQEYSPRRYDEGRRDYRDAEHRERYDEYDGRDYYDRYEPPQRVSYSMPREMYEARRYRENSYRMDNRPVRDARADGDRDDRRLRNEYQSNVEADQDRDSKFYEERPHRTQPYDDYKEYGRVASSRPPRNVPHHLRTSILTNGLPRPQSQRPISVRNSAVTRVGVGLPDYE